MPSAHMEQELAERLWAWVRPLPPQEPPKPKGGRPRADDRARFAAVLFVLRSGCRWRDLPASFPSPVTCWRRHRDWTDAGVWHRVWQVVLGELQAVGRLDASELAFDGTAPRSAPSPPRPTSTRRTALASIPAGVAVPPDVPVVADRAYDADPPQAELAGDGYRLVTPRRCNRVRPPTNDDRRMRRYRRRYVVERTFGWLHNFRRVMVRHEWYSFIHGGFFDLACALIALRRL